MALAIIPNALRFPLFVEGAACREKNNMVILSAADGHIITDLLIGVGCGGATFNHATMEAFSSLGDDTLTVVKEDSLTSFRMEQTVATPARAKTLTLDTKINQIFLITAEYGPVPAAPAQAAPSPAGSLGVGAPPSSANDSTFLPDPCGRQSHADSRNCLTCRAQKIT